MRISLQTEAASNVVFASLSAAGILLAMVGISIFTGVSQQTFEFVDNLSQFQSNLIEGGEVLRLILALDNIFIACYASTIIFLVRALSKQSTNLVLGLMLGMSISAATLDYIENFHILAMLMSLENGGVLSATQMEGQMVASALKWHLAYFAFFLLGLSFNARNRLQTLFKWSLIAWQLPVGVAVYHSWGTVIGDVLFYIRYVNLVVGFIFIAVFFMPIGAKLGPPDGAITNAAHV